MLILENVHLGCLGGSVDLSIQLLILAQVMIYLMVHEFMPLFGCALTAQDLLGILPPSLSAPTLLTHSLSLSQNKLEKKRKCPCG